MLMQHIAIITTSFPQNVPGSEAAGSFVFDFATELVKHTKVSVIAPGKETSTDNQDGISINRFLVPRLPLAQLSIINPCHWLAIYRTVWGGMQYVSDLCRTEQYDYIFALWALPSGYWAGKVRRSFNTRYAVWALGSDIWKFSDRPLLKNILRKVLVEADQCFADGHLLKKDVERISGRSCHFLPSARKINIEQPPDKHHSSPYRIAYLGRWHPNKGIDLLLQSLAMLDDRDWNKIEEIKICGGGMLESIVSDSIQKLKSSGRPVTQGGYLSKEEATDLIKWADYLLIPSRIESIPVIFSDAMQCNTPVIAMPVGDLPEIIIRNNVGLIAEEVSAPAYTDVLRKALSSSPHKYKKGISEVREKFDIRNIVNRFLVIINDNQ